MLHRCLYAYISKPQVSGKMHLYKTSAHTSAAYISTSIIGIYLQTMRSQIRLFLKEQLNTDPQRSTENGKDNTADVKADDLVVSDAPKVESN